MIHTLIVNLGTTKRTPARDLIHLRPALILIKIVKGELGMACPGAGG
jgi:hypothetical protein